MPEAADTHYEDFAAAALFGRFRMIWQFNLTRDEYLHEIARRGPLFRQETTTYGPRSYRKPFDEDEVGPAIVRGVKTIDITLAPGLDQSDNDVSCLLEIAHLSGVAISAESPNDPYNVRTLQVSIGGPRGGGGIRSTLGANLHTVHAAGEGPSFVSEHIATSGSPDVRKRVGVALGAHDVAKWDLFVTDDDGLIQHRNRVDSIYSGCGIVSPAEAVMLVYAVLRGRNQYLFAGNYRVSEDMFFRALTEWQIPRTVAAFRHLLGELHDGGIARAAVDTVESIIGRFESLLMASDEVGRLHLSESRQGGGSDFVARYLGILRESVTLYASALDACALAVTQLDALTTPDLASIAWWKLKRDKGVFQTLSSEYRPMQAAASSTDEIWPNLVSILRQRHHHRDGVQCLTVKIEHDGLTYATFTALHLESLQSSDIPNDLPLIHGAPLVQPIDFQFALVRSLSAILEQVFDSVLWSKSAWYESYFDREALHTFGRGEISNCVKQWWWS